MSSSAPVGDVATDGDEEWAAPPLLGVEFPGVLPLPRVRMPTSPQEAGGKAGLRRARWRAREINAAIDAVNWYGGHRQVCQPTVPDEDQRGAQSRVGRLVDFAFPPSIAHPAPAAAFKELLRGRSVYDLAAAGINVAPYTRLRDLSLPTTVADALELLDALPKTEHHFLDPGLEHMLRASDEFIACEAPHAYWGVRLRTSHAAYKEVMLHLIKIGLVIALPAGSAKERVGMFS